MKMVLLKFRWKIQFKAIWNIYLVLYNSNQFESTCVDSNQLQSSLLIPIIFCCCESIPINMVDLNQFQFSLIQMNSNHFFILPNKTQFYFFWQALTVSKCIYIYKFLSLFWNFLENVWKFRNLTVCDACDPKFPMGLVPKWLFQ